MTTVRLYLFGFRRLYIVIIITDIMRIELKWHSVISLVAQIVLFTYDFTPYLNSQFYNLQFIIRLSV